MLSTVGAATLVLVAAAAGATPSSGTCVSAPVHYERSPQPDLPLPWVRAGARGREVVAYLFYYTPELRTSDRLRIYTGGRLPDGRTSTKILWVPRQPRTSLLTITGVRLDGPGTFEQELRAARSGRLVVFPSIVDVRDAGCWRLTVRNG